MASPAGVDTTPISDPKKRAFEALERSLPKEEQRKRRREATNKVESDKDANISITKEESSPKATIPSTKKDPHHAYSVLPEGINEKLLNIQPSVTNKGDVVNQIIYDLVQHGEEGNKFRRNSLRKKIEHCILLDNAAPNSNVTMAAQAKALQSHAKRSKKHMSLKQHRKCGSFDIPREFHRFELFKPMHDMWKAYIIEIVNESRKKQLAQRLLEADLHGAFLVVVECKTASFVGFSGIMIRETAETFGIIKQDDCFRMVPKHGSVFIFQVGCLKVTLQGDRLSSRNIF
ncbi:hypothetical protein HPP92_026974 [Vanilla planifolia]|uniref:Uncharacterized protein n=1 Tax=Vanilla planifolia TaxID=51239 RepID=A0A835PDQ0_VANPL|nr:hypothetical protein HPP92_026974 [Vanilla planifolia]